MDLVEKEEECLQNESRDTGMSDAMEMDKQSRVVLVAGCSETFRRALHYDVYNTTTSPTSTITSTSTSTITCDPVMLTDDDGREDDDADGDEENDEEVRMSQTAGQRAWNRLRVYVDEQSVRRRHNNAAMNWTFIHRTLGAISQLQQSRAVLYDRYIEHPDDWLRGFINSPTQLLAQRRNAAPATAAANDPSRRQRITTTKHNH